MASRYIDDYSDSEHNLSVIEDADSSSDESPFIRQRQRDILHRKMIDEAEHLLHEDESGDAAVDTIDVNTTPVITSRPHYATLADIGGEGLRTFEQAMPLISGNMQRESSPMEGADTEPMSFECSRAYFCRRSVVIRGFYIFVGVLCFCAMIVLADEIGVSTIEGIRRYKNRQKHHSSPSRHSKPYPGPSYLRADGEALCQHELAFYEQDPSRFAVVCDTEWSYQSTHSVQLSCDDGYVLRCLLSTSYGVKSPGTDCASFSVDGDGDAFLPEAVWEADCVGKRECSLSLEDQLSHCSDVSGVLNTYYESVNGHRMKQFDGGVFEECPFAAFNARAVCEAEKGE